MDIPSWNSKYSIITWIGEREGGGGGGEEGREGLINGEWEMRGDAHFV